MNFLRCEEKNVILDLEQQRLSMLIAGESRMGKTYFMSQYGSYLLEAGETVHLIDLGDKWSSEDKQRTGIHRIMHRKDGIDIYFESVDSLLSCVRFFANALGYSSGEVIETLKKAMKRLVENRQNGFTLAELAKVLENQKDSQAAQKVFERLDCGQTIPNVRFSVNKIRALETTMTSTIWDLAGYDDWSLSVVSQLIIYSLYEMKRSIFHQGKRKKRTFVFLDEFQNLNYQQNSIIGKCLTEGQKYDMYMVLATQFLHGKFSDAVKNQFKQGGFQIFFRMTEEEAVTTAGRLEYETERQKELREILSNLPQGRFLLKGAHRIDGCAQVTERLRVIDVQPAAKEEDTKTIEKKHKKSTVICVQNKNYR